MKSQQLKLPKEKHPDKLFLTSTAEPDLDPPPVDPNAAADPWAIFNEPPSPKFKYKPNTILMDVIPETAEAHRAETAHRKRVSSPANPEKGQKEVSILEPLPQDSKTSGRGHPSPRLGEHQGVKRTQSTLSVLRSSSPGARDSPRRKMGLLFNKEALPADYPDLLAPRNKALVNSLPYVRYSGSRFLTDLKGFPYPLQEQASVGSEDYNSHKKYVDGRLEKFIEYMQGMEQAHNYTLQEFLSMLRGDKLPKYSWASDARLKEAWVGLQNAFETVCAEIKARQEQLYHKEERVGLMFKKHLMVQKEREVIFERVAELLQIKLQERENFYSTQKQAKDLLDEAKQQLLKFSSGPSLLQRRAKHILEVKYKDGWSKLKIGQNQPQRDARRAREINNYQPREYWKDYGIFSRYEKDHLEHIKSLKRTRKLPPVVIPSPQSRSKDSIDVMAKKHTAKASKVSKAEKSAELPTKVTISPTKQPKSTFQ